MPRSIGRRRQRRDQVPAGTAQAAGRVHAERKVRATPLKSVPASHFEEFHKARKAGSFHTMVFVRLLAKLLRDPEIGKLISRSFRTKRAPSAWSALPEWESTRAWASCMSRSIWIRSSITRKRKTDRSSKRAITEAGSMCSFIAAGTAYSNHGINTIPFFIYYSMFGFQRIGDLIWAAADMRTRGFLVEAPPDDHLGRLRGSAPDGHSHVQALSVPNCLATIGIRLRDRHHIQDGIRRMYVDASPAFYYLTSP